MFIGRFSASQQIIAVTPKGLLEIQFPETKGHPSSWMTFSADHFPYNRDWPTSGNKFQGSTRCFFKSYRIVSIGRKNQCNRNLQNKLFISGEKRVWPFFSHITEYGRPVVFFLGSTKLADNYCASYSISSLGPNRPLKTIFPEISYLCH